MNVWLIAAVSADGKIAQSADQNSMDWTSKEDMRFFVQKTKEAGVVIMGRTTFDTIGRSLPGRRVIVMTRQQGRVFDGEGVEYTTFGAEDLLEALRAEGVESVVIAGGASIYSQFLGAGLVTDLFLTIEPVLFATGVPLVQDIEHVDLRLVESRALNDQAVLFHYQPKHRA